MTYIYILYILANIADFLSTISYGLYNFEVEENPLARLFWENGGPAGLLLQKSLTTALFILIVHGAIDIYPRLKWILIPFTIGSAIFTLLIAGTNLGIINYDYTSWINY